MLRGWEERAGWVWISPLGIYRCRYMNCVFCMTKVRVVCFIFELEYSSLEE